jgi:hypothetical protein
LPFIADFGVPPTIVRPEQEILQATEKLFGDQDQHQRKIETAARAQLERTLTLASVKKINQTSVEYAKRKLEKVRRNLFTQNSPEKARRNLFTRSSPRES